MGTSQVSIPDEWINKILNDTPHNGIFNHKKKWSTDTCCDMNEPWKDAKWKRQTSKAWFHYLQCPEWINLYKQKSDL